MLRTGRKVCYVICVNDLLDPDAPTFAVVSAKTATFSVNEMKKVHTICTNSCAQYLAYTVVFTIVS